MARRDRIIARVGEVKTLVLVPDEFMDLEPFSVAGGVPWFKSDGPGGLCSAGLELTHVDERSLKELRELVQLMTLTFE